MWVLWLSCSLYTASLEKLVIQVARCGMFPTTESTDDKARQLPMDGEDLDAVNFVNVDE